MAKKKKTSAEDLRAAINVLALIDALEQHVLGQKEMSASQVNAALSLLKKTMPDVTDPKRVSQDETSSAHEDALLTLE